MSVSAPDPPAENVAHVLDAARAAMDREFQRAQRFDAKASGQSTLAGSWFAVTQAVTAAVISTHHAGWLVAWLALLLGQAVALCLLLLAAARVWQLREREDVGFRALKAMTRDVGLPTTQFVALAVECYGRVLTSQKAANKTRTDALGGPLSATRRSSVSFYWWWVLLIGLAEIAAAMLSRLT